MNFKCKPDSPAKNIEVVTHEKCLILHVEGKNTLYEFKDGDKLLFDLRIYITLDEIEKVKSWISFNCSKAVFKSPNTTKDNQLSLF